MSSTINELMLCANSWQPSVCLVGNVTAGQLRVFCEEQLALRQELDAARPVLALAQAWLESWLDAEARPDPDTLPAEAALYDALVSSRRAEENPAG